MHRRINTKITMASNETFNAENLEGLGAKRLSELLFELSNWDNVLKQQLLMELACSRGPKEAVREISKGFERMATSISYAEWNNADPLARELDAHRDAIVRHVASKKPREALALIWRFMGFAEDAILKCYDGFSIECVFREACNDLVEIAKAAKLEPEELAQQVFDALQDNNHGQYDKLIPAIGPVLGSEGLAHLKELIFEFRRGPVPVPDESVPEVSRIGADGTEDNRQSDYEREEKHRQSCFRDALLEIADVQGDLDAFIAEYESDAQKNLQSP